MEKFVGNHKSENFKKIIADLKKTFEKLDCLMNLKLHFLDSHVSPSRIKEQDVTGKN